MFKKFCEYVLFGLVTVFFTFSLVYALTGCSQNVIDNYDDVITDVTAVENNSAARSIETLLVDNSGFQKGNTMVTIADEGFTTAITKYINDVAITFVIVNFTMDKDTINDSVYYLNSTYSLVANMTVVDFYVKCKNLADNNELVNDCGICDFHIPKVGDNKELKESYVFTVAYNNIYLELFYE